MGEEQRPQASLISATSLQRSSSDSTAACPHDTREETSQNIPPNTASRPHHLRHHEGVLEVVEGHVVVVLIYAEQPVLQHLQLDIQAEMELEVDVHLSQQQHQLGVLPVPVVEVAEP